MGDSSPQSLLNRDHTRSMNVDHLLGSESRDDVGSASISDTEEDLVREVGGGGHIPASFAHGARGPGTIALDAYSTARQGHR